MTYLLDVNSLLALGVRRHVFHNRVLEWIARLTRSGIPQIGTCSITELGFVRVLSQARQYGFSVVEARELLLGIKASTRLILSSFPTSTIFHDCRPGSNSPIKPLTDISWNLQMPTAPSLQR